MDWTWGKTHSLTFRHVLGDRQPLNLLFNVGPLYVPGGRETPAHFSGPVGPAPWSVSYGPSARTIIDWGHPQSAIGILPLGQSGVLFDRHYADQTHDFVNGEYQPEHLGDADVSAHTRSTLVLNPASTP